MQENRFEAIGASPSYTHKEIKQHLLGLDMPNEEKELIRQALLDAGTRMEEELGTFRESEYEWTPTEADERVYRRIMSLLLPGIFSWPVPGLTVVSRWFRAFMASDAIFASLPLPDAAAVAAAADAIKDPWDAQTMALFHMRAALALEQEGREDATGLWDKSLEWWQKFFASASVKDSYTYQMQRDDSSRAVCREVWDGYINQIAKGIYQRCTSEYFKANKPQGVGVCLSTLALPRVKAIAGTLSDQALGEAELNLQAQLDAAYAGSYIKGVAPLLEDLPDVLWLSPLVAAKAIGLLKREAERRQTDDKAEIAAAHEIWDWMLYDLDDLLSSKEVDIALKSFYSVLCVTFNVLFNKMTATQSHVEIADILLILDMLPMDYSVAEKLPVELAASIAVSRIFKKRIAELAATGAVNTLRARASELINSLLNEREFQNFIKSTICNFVREGNPAQAEDFSNLRIVFRELTGRMRMKILYEFFVLLAKDFAALKDDSKDKTLFDCIPMQCDIIDPYDDERLQARKLVSRCMVNEFIKTHESYEAQLTLPDHVKNSEGAQSYYVIIYSALIEPAVRNIKRVYNVTKMGETNEKAWEIRRGLVTGIANKIMEFSSNADKIQLLKLIPGEEEVNTGKGSAPVTISELLGGRRPTSSYSSSSSSGSYSQPSQTHSTPKKGGGGGWGCLVVIVIIIVIVILSQCGH
jgi:hypothetical protein